MRVKHCRTPAGSQKVVRCGGRHTREHAHNLDTNPFKVMIFIKGLRSGVHSNRCYSAILEAKLYICAVHLTLALALYLHKVPVTL